MKCAVCDFETPTEVKCSNCRFFKHPQSYYVGFCEELFIRVQRDRSSCRSFLAKEMRTFKQLNNEGFYACPNCGTIRYEGGG
jgi:hypothetical protein